MVKKNAADNTSYFQSTLYPQLNTDLLFVDNAYAQADVPAFSYIKFQIVKIKLLDNKGNELLVQ